MRRRPHRKRILRCPTCGSVRIVLSAGSITGQVYHCLDCQYIGSLVFESDVTDDGTPIP
jgi:DNA-directed RNA polymerase subunit RPC12/RpoP